MQIVYIPSESMSVQGKKDEIYKRYGKDWNIREQGGGNGNWLLTRKSDVLVDGQDAGSGDLPGQGLETLCGVRQVLIGSFAHASLRFLWRVLFPRCLSIDELSQVYTFLTACAVYPRGRKSA